MVNIHHKKHFKFLNFCKSAYIDWSQHWLFYRLESLKSCVERKPRSNLRITLYRFTSLQIISALFLVNLPELQFHQVLWNAQIKRSVFPEKSGWRLKKHNLKNKFNWDHVPMFPCSRDFQGEKFQKSFETMSSFLVSTPKNLYHLNNERLSKLNFGIVEILVDTHGLHGSSKKCHLSNTYETKSLNLPCPWFFPSALCSYTTSWWFQLM